MEKTDPSPLELAVIQIQKQKEWFNRVISCFSEEDAAFRPREGMLSVAGQINHVTNGLEIFLAGVILEFDRLKSRTWSSRRRGAVWPSWDMEWSKNSNSDPVQTDESLAGAVQAFNETIDMVAEVFAGLSEQELIKPLAPNPMRVLTPQRIVNGICDHSAHHRGALSQYARLLGKDPKLPYFEMSDALHEAQFMKATSRGGRVAATA